MARRSRRRVPMWPMSSRFARAQTKSDLRKLKSLAKSLSLLTLDRTYTITTHLHLTLQPPIHQKHQPHRLTTINTRPQCSSASSPPLPQQLNPPSAQQQPHPLDHNSSAQQHPQSNKRPAPTTRRCSTTTTTHEMSEACKRTLKTSEQDSSVHRLVAMS